MVLRAGGVRGCEIRGIRGDATRYVTSRAIVAVRVSISHNVL